jgi:hypothetical protein
MANETSTDTTAATLPATKKATKSAAAPNPSVKINIETYCAVKGLWRGIAHRLHNATNFEKPEHTTVEWDEIFKKEMARVTK